MTHADQSNQEKTMKPNIKMLTISAIALGLSACATTQTGLSGYETAAVTHYQCGQDQVTATFLNKEQNSIALVSVNNESPTLLANVIAASGAKYQGGIYQLWTKGDQATFTNLMAAPNKAVQCKTIKTQA